MRRNLFLSAAIAACLAAPAVSLADPPPDNGKKKEEHGQQQHQGQGGQQGQGQQGQGQQGRGQQGRGGPQGGSSPQGPAPAGGAGANAGAHHRSAGGSGGQFQQAQPNGATFQAQHQGGGTAQQFQGRSIQSQTQNRQLARRQPAPAPLGDWNRNVRGADRDRAGQQWRQGHQGWDSSAVWRRNPDWWRGDVGFRLYLGPRNGFFFVPELGYVSVPEQYRQHYWRPGDYLPEWFWRYQVRDYERYGLPEPPDGCAWVWLGGDVALVDPSDGYVIDIVRNVW